MSGLDPRQVRTRAALVTAAIELVDERDTDKISVTDLAGRAGVSRKSLYLNFADRDALLQTGGLHRYKHALDEYHRSGAGGLEGTANAVISHLRDHRSFYRRLLSGSCGVETYRGIQGFLAQGIDRAAEQRGISLKESERLFLSGGAMAFLVWSLDSERSDMAAVQAAAGLAELVVGYLGAHSGRKSSCAADQLSEIMKS